MCTVVKIGYHCAHGSSIEARRMGVAVHSGDKKIPLCTYFHIALGLQESGNGDLGGTL